MKNWNVAPSIESNVLYDNNFLMIAHSNFKFDYWNNITVK